MNPLVGRRLQNDDSRMSPSAPRSSSTSRAAPNGEVKRHTHQHRHRPPADAGGAKQGRHQRLSGRRHKAGVSCRNDGDGGRQHTTGRVNDRLQKHPPLNSSPSEELRIDRQRSRQDLGTGLAERRAPPVRRVTGHSGRIRRQGSWRSQLTGCPRLKRGSCGSRATGLGRSEKNSSAQRYMQRNGYRRAHRAHAVTPRECRSTPRTSPTPRFAFLQTGPDETARWSSPRAPHP